MVCDNFIAIAQMNLELKSYLGIPLLPPPSPPPLRVTKQKAIKSRCLFIYRWSSLEKKRGKKKKGRAGEAVQKRARNAGGLRASSGRGGHERGLRTTNGARDRRPPNRAPPDPRPPGAGSLCCP